jgi:hypothetical protein
MTNTTASAAAPTPSGGLLGGKLVCAPKNAVDRPDGERTGGAVKILPTLLTRRASVLV